MPNQAVIGKRPDPLGQPYMGVSEVASFTGIARGYISSRRFHKSNNWPKPVAELRMGPIWATADWIRWKHFQDMVIPEPVRLEPFHHDNLGPQTF